MTDAFLSEGFICKLHASLWRIGQQKILEEGYVCSYMFISLWSVSSVIPKSSFDGEVKILHQDFGIPHSNRYMFLMHFGHFVISPWTKIPNKGGTIWLNRPFDRFANFSYVLKFYNPLGPLLMEVPPPMGLSPPHGLGNEVDALSTRSKHVCVCVEMYVYIYIYLYTYDQLS